MANEPTITDNENQSLRKINAEISALNADVADGININGITASTQAFRPASLHNGTTFNTSSAGTNVVLAANASRLGFSITNCDASAILYIRFANAAATSTAFNVRLGPNERYEQTGVCVYTGVITGLYSASPTNSARIAEFTA